MKKIDRLVIVGAGLIGGSLALALKQAGAVRTVVGLGRRIETLQQAQALGIIDEIAISPQTALRAADVVVLAMPVAQTHAVLQSLLPHLEAHTLVSDAGSTKTDVILAARAVFGSGLKKNEQNGVHSIGIHQFVPAHPIAGSEHNGPAAAHANLYQDKKVVITPLPENSDAAIHTIRALWETCGAHVQTLSAKEHDAVFAAVSHLPHLLSYALVDDLAQRNNAEQLFSFAASGFRDFTRIASSSPEMWRDIALANRSAVLHELNAYQNQLQVLQNALQASDGAALEKMFNLAKTARDAWIRTREQ